MSAHPNTQVDSPTASRWKLWVDGCGGFLLLSGDRWTVGGFDPQSPADICVRADWPRRAGTITRKGADYFWQASPDRSAALITSANPLPIAGSATMTLDCPSPLSSSATLNLRAPHRFDGHVDAAILVEQTLLIGPSRDCHIRASEFPDQLVLVNREGQWQAKTQQQDTWTDLALAQRMTLGTIALTLEPA